MMYVNHHFLSQGRSNAQSLSEKLNWEISESEYFDGIIPKLFKIS